MFTLPKQSGACNPFFDGSELQNNIVMFKINFDKKYNHEEPEIELKMAPKSRLLDFRNSKTCDPFIDSK